MKKSTLDTIKTFCCLIPLIILTRMIATIPWWSFVIPVALFGTFITFRQWQVATFFTGFLSGLVIWVCANIYFHTAAGGNAFDKIGLVLSVPGPLVILISGIIGGLLTGLALYTGQSAIYRERLIN